MVGTLNHSESYTEVCGGAWRDMQRCAEVCAEVHGGVCRGMQRYTEMCGGVCGSVQKCRRCVEVCRGVQRGLQRCAEVVGKNQDFMLIRFLNADI